MARLDWAVLCDLAFFDRQDRLCLVEIFRNLATPGLPPALHQAMLAAHVTDIRRVERMEIAP